MKQERSQRIVITASSCKHWIPCSMVFQGLCCSWRSSGQRYLSFTVVKSHIQRLRGSGLLAIPWSIPTSRDRDSKCLTSVPSKISISHGPAQCNKLPLFGAVTAIFFQIFCYLSWVQYLFKGELPNYWGRIFLQNLAHFLHIPCHSVFSTTGADLWATSMEISV